MSVRVCCWVYVGRGIIPKIAVYIFVNRRVVDVPQE